MASLCARAYDKIKTTYRRDGVASKLEWRFLTLYTLGTIITLDFNRSTVYSYIRMSRLAHVHRNKVESMSRR